MAVTQIHVNKQWIAQNNKNPDDRKPPISVIYKRRTYHGTTVSIAGPSTVVYRPDSPLHCGAQVWIETQSEVDLDGVPVQDLHNAV